MSRGIVTYAIVPTGNGIGKVIVKSYWLYALIVVVSATIYALLSLIVAAVVAAYELPTERMSIVFPVDVKDVPVTVIRGLVEGGFWNLLLVI